MPMNVCKWQVDDDGTYATQCNNYFAFDAGGPESNGFKFCPYCGSELEETKCQ